MRNKKRLRSSLIKGSSIRSTERPNLEVKEETKRKRFNSGWSRILPQAQISWPASTQINVDAAFSNVPVMICRGFSTIFDWPFRCLSISSSEESVHLRSNSQPRPPSWLFGGPASVSVGFTGCSSIPFSVEICSLTKGEKTEVQNWSQVNSWVLANKLEDQTVHI